MITVIANHFRTRANRRQWIAERLWARKLPLQDRLSLLRDGEKREFLPVRPIWHRIEQRRLGL